MAVPSPHDLGRPNGTIGVRDGESPAPLTAPLVLSARCYAKKLRWHVLPLYGITADHCACRDGGKCNPGKHPRTRHGLKDASLDQTWLQERWKEAPNSNIGIRTGAASHTPDAVGHLGSAPGDITGQFGGDD